VNVLIPITTRIRGSGEGKEGNRCLPAEKGKDLILESEEPEFLDSRDRPLAPGS